MSDIPKIEINDKSHLTLNGKLICVLETTCLQNLSYYVEERSGRDKMVEHALNCAIGEWYIQRGTRMINEILK